MTPLQVLPSIYADLAVSEVAAPATAIAGQPVTVSWKVTNVGNDPAPNKTWHDAVFLSKDQVLDESTDVKLGVLNRSGGLGIGENYRPTMGVTIPQGSSGPYYILVMSDSAGQVEQTWARGNNIATLPAAMQVSLAPPSDLDVANVTATLPNGLPGSLLTVTWTVNNTASNPARGTWYDAVYLSRTPEAGADAILVAQQQGTRDVAAGGSYLANGVFPLPALTPGNYYVIVRSDIRNNVRETDETNNAGSSAGTVSADVPELILGMPLSGDLSSGVERYYKVLVEEDQTLALVLSSLSPASANELYVRRGALPNLGTYDFAYSRPLAANQEITVPTTEAGFYYILVRGASVPEGSAQFSLQGNIIPFSITSVTPNRIGDNGQVTITVKGARFRPGLSIDLRNASAPWCPAKSCSSTALPPRHGSTLLTPPTAPSTWWSRTRTIPPPPLRGRSSSRRPPVSRLDWCSPAPPPRGPAHGGICLAPSSTTATSTHPMSPSPRPSTPT